MEFENKIYTKQDFIDIFLDLGIHQGSQVLLEADLSRYTNIVGSYQMLIETLQEVITPSGCLCMPCFSYSCLDPACLENVYPFETWKEVRAYLPGFHVVYTPSEIYKDCTNLFLHYKDVYRSNHPVYSFAYWGTFDMSVLKVDVNEAINLKTSLAFLHEKNACNLLIGVKPKESLLVQALASEYQLGQMVVQRAFIHSKRRLTKSFLIHRVDPSLAKDLLDCCKIKKSSSPLDMIYSLSKKGNE